MHPRDARRNVRTRARMHASTPLLALRRRDFPAVVDLRPIRIAAEGRPLAAAATTASPRGISRIRLTRLAREETRRTVISAGTQKVNRSFARREEEEEKEEDEEEEKEEETEERKGAKKHEEKKREKEEEERTTSVRGRISFTAPAAAPRVIAAATSGGARRSSVQRVYVSARSRTSPPLLRASTRSWNTVIARPAYE